MKRCIAAIILCLTVGAAQAQQATSANSGLLRVLDKVTGAVTDLRLGAGETGAFGLLKITLNDCRYPSSNPSGDAYARLTVVYRDLVDPVFRGWLIASAPALNAIDHPRYDVWVLRCNNV